MNLTVFLRVLKARWFTIVSITLFAIVAATIVTILTPRSYTATTELIIDGKGQDPVTGQTLPAQLLSGYIATQADIIRSRNVANKVIDQQALMNDPLVLREYRATEARPQPSRPWLLYFLEQGLSAEPKHGSNVLSISFKAQDPELAARLADAFANAYIRTNIELRVEPAKRTTEWYDSQLALLRKNLVRVQNTLASYQEEHSIIASSDRLDLETAKLAELSTMLLDAQNQRLDSLSRSKQLSKSNIGALPADVLANPKIQQLSTDLAQAKARLAELGSNVGPNHPQYKQASREVEAVQGQLDQALKQVGGSLRSTAELSRTLQEQLQAEVDAQKERVLQLNRNRNELALLRQEVDSAQTAYDAALARSTQTKMESQSALTDVAILNTAAVPSQPTEPKPARNLVLATMLGLLLGTALALCGEWMDHRVRSASELETRLGLPVLAYIPAPHKRWAKVRRAV